MQIILFNNGNTCISEKGKQLNEFQDSWLIIYIEYLIKKGIDPTKVEFILPDGNKAIIYKWESSYNWRIENANT